MIGGKTRRGSAKFSRAPSPERQSLLNESESVRAMLSAIGEELAKKSGIIDGDFLGNSRPVRPGEDGITMGQMQRGLRRAGLDIHGR